MPFVLQNGPSMKQYQTVTLGLNGSCEMRVTLH
jgi:hypothetical protein